MFFPVWTEWKKPLVFRILSLANWAVFISKRLCYSQLRQRLAFFLRWAKWQWFQLVMWISIPLPESQEALFWDCCWQMNWYSQPKSVGQNDWFLSWMLSLSSYVWWKWTMYEWFPLLHLHYHLNHLFPACACYSIMRIYARQDSPYKGHLYHKRPPRWAVSSWKHP